MSIQTLTLGGGCFWCVEALYQNLKGVISVVSGYAGGSAEQANYRDVCSGTTGHAEVIRIEYDDSEISIEILLDVFFHLHDPTTLNRQGADSGTQYRSTIFFLSPEQKASAEQVIQQIESEKLWRDPVVTTLEPLTEFFPAEEYHQNYYQQNSYQPYCQGVISPKIKKLKERYASLLTS